jgi:hypothetical protein
MSAKDSSVKLPFKINTRKNQFHGSAHIVWREEEAPSVKALEDLATRLCTSDRIAAVAKQTYTFRKKKYLVVFVQCKYEGRTAPPFQFGRGVLTQALKEEGLFTEDLPYGLAKVLKYDPSKATKLSESDVVVRKRGAKPAIAGSGRPAKKQRTGAENKVDNQEEEADTSKLAEVQKELAAVKQELENLKRARRPRVLYHSDEDSEADMPDSISVSEPVAAAEVSMSASCT